SSGSGARPSAAPQWWRPCRTTTSTACCSGWPGRSPRGGASTPRSAPTRRCLGEAPLEVYGSTETGGIAWRAQREGADGADWTPFPGMALETDRDGALRLRSPYLPDGEWLTLGDAAELLPGGRFRLKGRLDRVAKIEGKRVSLPELES